ncbi:MAG: TIGR03118 family protein [Blastocatellia bacterium]|nr:TIGR03118 family protein [Blastocatellia bacterium]
MKQVHRFSILGVALFTVLLGGTATAQRVVETDLVANKSPLVDANGITHVPLLPPDPSLKNPWGIGESATSPFWISDNGAGLATIYNTAGTKSALVVSIPSPGDPLGASGTPTGMVSNIANAAGGFKISGVDRNNNPVSAPANFIFSTEDGTIVGWNPNVNPVGFDPTKAGTYAIIAVDNSATANGAVYKGLAIATDSSGQTLLYATNFRSGAVDVFDTTFQKPASLAEDAFVDPRLNHGRHDRDDDNEGREKEKRGHHHGDDDDGRPRANYAPFNIVPVMINGATRLVVTYAIQDADKADDVAGHGHGIVDTFDLSGGSFHRFAQHGQLNSPWGVAVAPANFGEIAGDILIGNFGNGHINVFDSYGEFKGKLRDAEGNPVAIDGLWTIMVGNGGNGGRTDTVYFTAGPNGEADGLFGSLSPVAETDK